MTSTGKIFEYRKKKKINRKGNARAIMIGLVMILLLIAAGITFLLMHAGTQQINDDLRNQFGSAGDAVIDSNETNYPIWTDRAFTIVFVGYWLLCLLTAYVAPEHPLISLVLIIIIIVLAGLGAYFSNVWDDFASLSNYSAYRADFPKTDFLLTHYVEALLVIGFTSVYVYHLSSNRQGVVL